MKTLKIVIAAFVAATSLIGGAQAMGDDKDQRVIHVISATYGASCRVTPGNATKSIAARCNGKKFCDYTVSYKMLGDPARNCKKDFQVKYSCGRAGPFQASAPGEAGYGTEVALVCN